jgi:hypothetical protein
MLLIIFSDLESKVQFCSDGKIKKTFLFGKSNCGRNQHQLKWYEIETTSQRIVPLR